MLNAINIKFGEKVRALRLKRKMTQEELAEVTSIGYKYMQRIEGKNPPDIRLSTVERIAKALKTKVVNLLNF